MRIYFRKILTFSTQSTFGVMFLINQLNYCLAQPGNEIDQYFTSYQKKHLTEKLYVHTDKNFYIAGEILWLKVYDVDGTYHKPLGLSKVAYIEVLGSDMKPVIQEKIALNNGSGSGSFYLPVNLKSGNYVLRAYTSWMRNFSSEFFFQKKLSIINTLNGLDELAKQEHVADYDISFYPEGGNLVTGIKSKIAFQAVNSFGKGISFRGVVLDQNNDTVVVFSPSRFGIGYFYFTPRDGSSYRSIIKPSDGKPIVRNLPVVYPEGCVMHVTESNAENIAVNLYANNHDDEVFLFIHQGQQIIHSAKLDVKNARALAVVPKKQIPAGVSCITIFSKNKKPLCERLYYHGATSSATAKITSDKLVYSPRDKVSVDLTLSDKGLTGTADMSLSVFRLDSLDNGTNTSIGDYLLLTSELKGNVESPEYYGKNSDPEAIDNLMLTHGWRRFKWEDVFEAKKDLPKYLPEYDGHIISGKVTHTLTGYPAPNINAYLSVPGKHTQLFVSQSDSTGNIRFYTKDLWASNEIIVQTDFSRDSLYRIDISSPFAALHSAPYPPFGQHAKELMNTLNVRSINMQAANLYDRNKLHPYITPEIDSSSFYGKPSKQYKLDNYTRFTTMEEVLREYVFEVTVLRQHRKFQLWVFDPVSRMSFYGSPLVIIDGVPVFDMDKVIQYSPLKVEKAEILDKKFIYSGAYYEGIINFTTYKGDIPGLEIDPSATVLDYEGLQRHRQFYSPTYETKEKRSGTLPDFRDLLYWQPYVATREKGRATLNFYTSDQTGKYKIVLQGISSSGEPLHAETELEVK